MKRSHASLVLVLSLFLVVPAAFAKSNVPKANTRAAIKSYVQSAAKVIAKSGPSCNTFNSADWKSGDYYVFVVGPDDKLVCHANPAMVGKATGEIKNSSGRAVGAEINTAARKKGGGWVVYDWPRPGQSQDSKKTTYAMRVKGSDGKWYTVGAGGYDVK